MEENIEVRLSTVEYKSLRDGGTMIMKLTVCVWLSLIIVVASVVVTIVFVVMIVILIFVVIIVVIVKLFAFA